MKKNITYIFLFVLIGISIIYYKLDTNQKNTINFISVYGSIASIYGLIITYVQIGTIKTISEETEKSVKENTNKLNKIFLITEVSKGVKIVEQIQFYIRNKKYEMGILRMKDLKNILIQSKHVTELKEITNNNEFDGIISTLT